MPLHLLLRDAVMLEDELDVPACESSAVPSVESLCSFSQRKCGLLAENFPAAEPLPLLLSANHSKLDKGLESTRPHLDQGLIKAVTSQSHLVSSIY